MLHNLLPPLQTEYIEENRRAQVYDWKPSDAHPQQGKISRALQDYIEGDVEVDLKSSVRYVGETYPQQEPNRAHINQSVLTDLLLDGSPLCAVQRGVIEPPKLNYDTALHNKKEMIKFGCRDNDDASVLILRLLNWTSTVCELFTQNQLTLQSHTIPSGQHKSRTVNSNKKNISSGDETFQVLLSTLKDVAITMTARQEVKDFRFSFSERVGLEVELSSNRLICCQVYPNTQAEIYLKALDGAEILAVNGRRVLTLEDFGKEMERARVQYQQGEVSELVIKAASYVKGSSKSDDILHDVKRSRAMKSLLSNMMQVGSQDNYQGNFELRELDEDELDGDDGDGDGDAHPTDDNISVITGASGNYVLSIDGSSAANKDAYSEQQLESRDVFDCYNGDEHGLLAGKQQRDLDNDNESQSTVRSIQHLPIQTSKEEKPPLIKETSEKWNHLTNPFQQVMKPFVSLVCMPRTLRCSEGWGTPMRFLQVSNFSSRCLVEVNWVDEDGALVSRSVLKPGRTHVERCGSDHVWLISAIPFKSTVGAGYSTVAGSVGTAGTMGSSQTSLDFLQEEYMSEGAASGHSAAVMLFKPSNTALQHDRCTSLIWTPRYSVSIAQRIYSKGSKANLASVKPGVGMEEDVGGVISDFIQPHMHVQVFDFKESNNSYGHTTGAAGPSDTSLGERKMSTMNSIKPLRLPKWPMKEVRKSKK